MTSKNTPTNGKKPTSQRTIEIKNPMLVSLMKQKEELVTEGRAMSKELEAVSQKISEIQEKEKEYTKAVEVPELFKEGEKLQEEINAKMQELDKLSEKIKKEKLGNIPKELVDEHLALNKTRAKLEKDLNKIGLKIEKVKAKYIPKLQKIAQKELKNEYEDLETADLDGDTIVVKVFSHLEEWKSGFFKRKKENENKHL